MSVRIEPRWFHTAHATLVGALGGSRWMCLRKLSSLPPN